MQTTVKRPRKIDGRRARGTQFSGGGFDVVACGSSKRESVSTGEADKGGATHLEPADRFGDEPVVVYLDPALFVWEQGLIQKPYLPLRQPFYRHERFVRRVSRLRGHKKTSRGGEVLDLTLICPRRVGVGVGTVLRRVGPVAGLLRAVPSTALDESAAIQLLMRW